MTKGVTESIGVTIIASLVLSIAPNKSNFPDEIAIPVVATLISKLTIGDWDEGYQWSASDVVYWPVLLLAGFLTVKVLKSG